MTTLSDVAKTIKSGDLFLWRPEPSDWYGAAVCAGSGSAYAHAGMAVWIQQPFQPTRLWSLDMIRGVGGVAQPLDRLVQRWPGLCDVYQANAGGKWPGWNGDKAARYYMDWFLGLPYGDDQARQAARTRLPFWRWFFTPNRDDEAALPGPPFCSSAVASAAKNGGGVDPVLNLAAESTWPGDFAESPFYAFLHGELT